MAFEEWLASQGFSFRGGDDDHQEGFWRFVDDGEGGESFRRIGGDEIDNLRFQFEQSQQPQPKPIEPLAQGFQSMGALIAQFQAQHKSQFGKEMNRPWTVDADARAAGQRIIDEFHARGGQGNIRVEDLPVTAFAASQPDMKRGSSGFFKSGVGKVALTAAAAFFGGPAIAGALGTSAAAGGAIAGGLAGGVTGGTKGALLGAAGGFLGGGGLSEFSGAGTLGAAEAGAEGFTGLGGSGGSGLGAGLNGSNNVGFFNDFFANQQAIDGSQQTIFDDFFANQQAIDGSQQTIFDDFFANQQAIDGSQQTIFDASGGGAGFDFDLSGSVADADDLFQGGVFGPAPTGGVMQQLVDAGLPFDLVSKLTPSNLFSLAKQVFGGGGGEGGGTGGLFGQGGILGSGFSAGNVAALAPSLAAINFARNQRPDTSRLIDSFNQFDPNAGAGAFAENRSRLVDTFNQFDPNTLTGQFDLNTAQAREGLTSSLSQRGVLGSSFGQSDLTNFGTTRDVGRQSLINQGILSRAGIAGNILGADTSRQAAVNQGLLSKSGIAGNILTAEQTGQRNQNDLIGRALLALSGGLSPTKQSGFS